MALTRPENQERKNEFYRDKYNSIMMAFVLASILMMLLIGWVIYQVTHRPLPIYTAIAANGKTMVLTANSEPNYLPEAIIKWARKVAVAAYTYDFVNYNKQLLALKPYFTANGWADFQSTISILLDSVVQKQLFVNGVVSGAPVISNQGELSGGYSWRVQMPFLVTYQSADNLSQQNYFVEMTIVKVPTYISPNGLGVDQFVLG